MKLLNAGISDVSDDERNLSDYLNKDGEQDDITQEENGPDFQAGHFSQVKFILPEKMKILVSRSKCHRLDNDFLYN